MSNLLTLPKDNFIRTYKGEGMGYIRNSKGGTANAMLCTHCIINILDNTIASLVYTVTLFEPNWSDYYHGRFDTYTDALDMYNELTTKWSGDRPKESASSSTRLVDLINSLD